MSTREIRQQVALALAAVKDKKAEDIALLELPKESSAFTDYFLICSGTNPRQVQAIADAVDEALSKNGVEPNNREGFNTAEWICSTTSISSCTSSRRRVAGITTWNGSGSRRST